MSSSINNKFLTRNKIRLISNSHVEERDMLLDKLLKNADMSQATFAKKVGKDASTVNRWIKNNRSIAWDNAEKIAKVLNCHPVEIYKPSKKFTLQYSCAYDGYVSTLSKEEQHLIDVPYELHHDNLLAIQMECPGNHHDGEIWLFDIHNRKKICKNAVGKLCYLTLSKIFKQKNQKEFEAIGFKEWLPVVALLNPKGNGKLDIVNSYSGEPLNKFSQNLSFADLHVATPVKAKYDPERVHTSLCCQ